MSEEERRDDQIEVEGHRNTVGLDDDSAEDGVSEVEAHVQRFSNVRMDSPSNG
jgi:hypothetical protein